MTERKNGIFLGALLAGTLLTSTASFASDDETQARIDDLEDLVIDLEERLGSRTLARVFDSLKFDIGGFLHSTYTYVDTEGGSSGSFDRNNFELLIRADLNARWSAFFASGFLRESNDPLLNNGALRTTGDPVFDSNNRTPQIIAFANYKQNDGFNIRLGRQITPHGIINIEHFPATLLETEQPQFLRPFSGNTLFPNFFQGVQFHGLKFFDNSSTLGYQVYTGMFNGAPNSPVHGIRLSGGLSNQEFELGLNAHRGERIDGDSSSAYDMAGVDFKVDKGFFQLKAEYFETTEEVSTNDREAFYVQPAFRLNSQWVVFARYDELDVPQQLGKINETVVGVNYLPYNNVRLRLNATQREYEDQNDFEADLIQISGTFSF